MPKKIKAKSKIKTLSGRYDSSFNRSYNMTYYDLNNHADMEQHLKDTIKSDDRHNQFESLDHAIASQVNMVKDFLISLNLPSDENVDYKIDYDFNKKKILINGKTSNAQFSPLFKKKMEHHKLSGKGDVSADLSEILSNWFCHIPSVHYIGQFFHCIRQVKSYRKSGDIDRCAAYAIRATAFTRAIVEAKFEDYKFGQLAKQQGAVHRDRYIVKRWTVLQNEGISKEKASKKISEELKEYGYKIGVSITTIRDKLKEKNFNELLKR